MSRCCITFDKSELNDMCVLHKPVVLFFCKNLFNLPVSDSYSTVQFHHEIPQQIHLEDPQQIHLEDPQQITTLTGTVINLLQATELIQQSQTLENFVTFSLGGQTIKTLWFDETFSIL